MINAKKKWRKSEDIELSRIVQEFVERGEDIEIAFDAAGEALGRTARACRDEWHKINKRKRGAAPVVKGHDYANKLKNLTTAYVGFAEAYGDLDAVLLDLIEENEHLKQKVQRLEEVEKLYIEARQYFNQAI